MFSLAHLYNSASSYAAKPIHIQPIFMSIIFHHYKRLQEISKESIGCNGQPRISGVLVPAPEPRPGFVTPLRRPVEPLVHPPERVEAARIGGVGVVDDAIRERERTHARPL